MWEHKGSSLNVLFVTVIVSIILSVLSSTFLPVNADRLSFATSGGNSEFLDCSVVGSEERISA